MDAERLLSQLDDSGPLVYAQRNWEQATIIRAGTPMAVGNLDELYRYSEHTPISEETVRKAIETLNRLINKKENPPKEDSR